MFTNKDTILQTIRNFSRYIRETELFPYVQRITLYGSSARGAYTVHSDVDIFLELDESIREDHRLLRTVRAEAAALDDSLDIDLHYGFGDLASHSGLYYRNIQNDEVVLWEKEASSFE
jgi:predicted nucleotidyltransferase